MDPTATTTTTTSTVAEECSGPATTRDVISYLANRYGVGRVRASMPPPCGCWNPARLFETESCSSGRIVGTARQVGHVCLACGTRSLSAESLR